MIHGLSSCWKFLSRTFKDLSSFLAPLNKAIHLHLLPKLCLHPPNDPERAILTLPIHLGNIWSSEDRYRISVSITSPLATSIINQLSSFDCAIFHCQRDLRQEALSIKCQTLTDSLTLSATLPPNLQVSPKLAGKKNASSWLSTLPLECHGFALHKGEGYCFPLWYGLSPQNLPSNCVCGKFNTIEHVLSCPNGAFPTIWYTVMTYEI